MNLTNYLDYWQKKAYLHLHYLKKAFKSIPLGRQIGLALFLFLALSYPGQNFYQTLSFNPQQPKTLPVSLNLANNPIPVNDLTPPPSLTAQAIFVFEPDSGTILYQKNSDIRLFPASTTKMMTALIALDVYNLTDVLTVKNGEQAIGHSAKLNTGQSFTVKDLLYATLVSSGNDAALTLAENYQSGYSAFLNLMNQKAADLSLHKTNFTNVSGIESDDHRTTVRDLAILAKVALKNPIFKEIVGTKSTTITDVSGQSSYLIETTNELLGKVAGLQGVKTGWTQNAGECLVTFTQRDNKKIITVVLNSTNRFAESEKLIDWSFSHHTWQEL